MIVSVEHLVPFVSATMLVQQELPLLSQYLLVWKFLRRGKIPRVKFSNVEGVSKEPKSALPERVMSPCVGPGSVCRVGCRGVPLPHQQSPSCIALERVFG